jgi:hypothetical protein
LIITHLIIFNNKIASCFNKGGYGAGIDNTHANFSMSNTIFNNNTATIGNGGGILNAGDNREIVNNTNYSLNSTFADYNWWILIISLM